MNNDKQIHTLLDMAQRQRAMSDEMIQWQKTLAHEVSTADISKVAAAHTSRLRSTVTVCLSLIVIPLLVILGSSQWTSAPQEITLFVSHLAIG